MGRPHKKNREIINKTGQTIVSAKSVMFMVENILKHLTEKDKVTYLKTIDAKVKKFYKLYLNQNDHD